MGGPVELRGGVTGEGALVTVPLFHATGLLSGFLLPCLIAQKVALLRKWDAAIAMEVIVSEKITMLSTVPAILKDLLIHPELGDHDLSSITRVSASGAATPADLPDLLRDKLGIVTRSSGYGLTETVSVGATMRGPVFDLKPLASGIPSPIIEMRAADPADAALPRGEDGEVCHPRCGAVLTEEALRGHLHRQLPGLEVPKYLVMSEKPWRRNASEKIHRIALRDSFVAS
ncbi:AMP-binding protein [Nocardia miyunensis]|uniref:AMP-binding protein n=1 Tax=Nocardia miyunensis TaxID=282684 RepID=UPI00147139C6|nr:AMP-binding protein [Nocardia miyunensis]